MTKPQSFSSDLAVDLRNNCLKGTRIALGIGGGIAAIEAPRVARELRRNGAHVKAFPTQNALRFVGLDALEWATGQEVSVQPSGLAEHIFEHDALLMFSATADIIGKVAHGLCTDGLTTLAQSALGTGLPVLFAPTMHQSLAQSPQVQNNLNNLKNVPSVRVIPPRNEEGKWKARDPIEISLEVAHTINREKTQVLPKKVLITLGGTRVPLDDVRSLSNRSSGKLGTEFAHECYRQGLEVEVFACEATQLPLALDHLHIQRTESYDELKLALENLHSEDYSAVFMLAAVSDFQPKHGPQPGKMPSTKQELSVELERTDKLVLLPQVRQIPYRFVCKLTADSGRSSKERVEHLAKSAQAHAGLWNTTQQAFGSADPFVGQLFTTSSKGLDLLLPCSTKSEVAQRAVERFLQSPAGSR